MKLYLTMVNRQTILNKNSFSRCGTKKAIDILYFLEEIVESMRKTDYDTTEQLIKNVDRKCF